jgi:transaldolase
MATGNPLAQLGDQGVSVWVDSIARDWLEKGELRRLRDDFSVVGVTSNPTIFQAAIGVGGFYDDQLASLASFVSRVDTLIDPILGERVEEGGPDAELAGSRLGTAAVDNAKLAYQGWQELFAGPRWEALETRGARPQRCLWASTSTKNPNYRDVIYCEELIGRDTVNTMPLSTVEEVGEQLETEGVEKFAVSYQKLLDTIETKRAGAGG